jgi:glycosyltransferase involved in cell wall biosynthesis
VRILVAHSKYLSGDASGENRVVDDEVGLLADGRHEVTLWTPSPPADSSPATRLRLGLSAIWSGASLAELRHTIDRTGAQIVHFHNLFPLLSPAALRAASDCGAAVVLTLHNYRYSCLPATFFRDGRPCEACLGRLPWRGVVYRCYRHSALGSASLASSLAAHRVLGSFDRVDLFVAISEFVRKKHLEAGLPGTKIIVKTHFSKPSPRRVNVGDPFLFLGRLSPEKGLDALLPVWTEALGRLVVVGDGPERAMLEASAPPGWEFMGTVAADAVPELIANARAVVVPSKGYEGAGKVVMESFAAGVPVVARRMGALEEVVEHERTGLLVDVDDPQSWRAALLTLIDDERNRRMGNEAYEQWANRFSPTPALGGLEEAYRLALTNRAARKK